MHLELFGKNRMKSFSGSTFFLCLMMPPSGDVICLYTDAYSAATVGDEGNHVGFSLLAHNVAVLSSGVPILLDTICDFDCDTTIAAALVAAACGQVDGKVANLA